MKILKTVEESSIKKKKYNFEIGKTLNFNPKTMLLILIIEFIMFI